MADDTTTKDPSRQFDLRPHPRILPMLGEINFQQWQCLAELIDNSIDAFLSARRTGTAIQHRQVAISLPMSSDSRARISVRDNGPGMAADTLENAVKAGWTGNDPMGYLGMFGMGFNIATARLGTVTEVWSTQKGDREWIGLQIDFDKLITQRHFRTPVLVRPKTNAREHGTEVTIKRLKPEQLEWLAKPGNRSRINRRLREVYSSMLQGNGEPIGIHIEVNGNKLIARRHCAWGDTRSPERIVNHNRFGRIRAFQVIDHPLSERRFCTKCWIWLAVNHEACLSCESARDVVTRERRVHGWLGVQRYLDRNEYGIDFLRHGRKIEMANRDLFSWQDDGPKELEYPIDDPRQRGRLVGEIHLDHCRVTYTKDQFDRNDPAWSEMVHIIRGEGPLRPDKARERGYGKNRSPLFLLFQAFRRSTPKPKVPGCYARLLVVRNNDQAQELAKQFHAQRAEYQSDQRWWELVEEEDKKLLAEDEPSGGADDFFDDDDPSDTEPGGDEPEGKDSEEAGGGEIPQLPRREPIPSLTREYRENITDQRWTIKAYSVVPDDPELADGICPWSLRRHPSVFKFFVATSHPVFLSATMTPLDALLAELAWSAMDFMRGGSVDIAFGAVLTSLRERYAQFTKLDPTALSADASRTLRSIGASSQGTLSTEDARILFEELRQAEQETILHRLAGTVGTQATTAIDIRRFLEYAPGKTIRRFFEEYPELFFDGLYWDTAYKALDYGRQAVTDSKRQDIVARYSSLLLDAVWLAGMDPEDLAEFERARLLRASLALELLAPDVGDYRVE